MTETQQAPAGGTDQDGTPLGTVTWWEIPVADLDVSSTFLTAVFGWTFMPFGEGYLGILNGGGPETLVGGIFKAEPEQVAAAGIQVYINVRDMEDTLAKASAAGGTVRTPRTEVGGDMGWWAEIVDPGGRRIGLCTGSAAA
ncbi:hypothetical protein GIS00_09885 [Nakamurella sp. YIM 132087]|uniref:VOC domain-containing protein n=1 Tax=Nakamurella alba TaxID=2665158 RepID=A0A7K1FJK2_9ACTN|nr:VOC family protein [Nakamurella alba]MTD14256.1 hypothetical protein [Nakamurella alba]